MIERASSALRDSSRRHRGFNPWGLDPHHMTQLERAKAEFEEAKSTFINQLSALRRLDSRASRLAPFVVIPAGPMGFGVDLPCGYQDKKNGGE
jgi:hypothetical protein